MIVIVHVMMHNTSITELGFFTSIHEQLEICKNNIKRAVVVY